MAPASTSQAEFVDFGPQILGWFGEALFLIIESRALVRMELA